MGKTKKVFIALGSNIGDRLSYLGKGILSLSQQDEIKLTGISSIYETAPVGYLEQNFFYNMVIEVETTLTARELLTLCLKIETKFGRERSIPNGPRTLDIDILLYENEQYTEEDCLIPHPRLQERSFVLVPLVELSPDLVHPVLEKPMHELLAELNQSGVVKLQPELIGKECHHV